MVSSINTNIRLFAQQAALNAFRDNSADTASTSSSQTSGQTSGMSLANYFYSGDSETDDDGDFEDTQLSALIASLQQLVNGGSDENDGSVDDMSSTAFMKALRDKLETLKDNPDTATMAEAMLKALEAGTLTVTNAEAGEQVTAFDPAGGAKGPAEKNQITTTDWSSYLKELLARDGSGKFIRNGDSSYIEKASGASSYFGMVGDAYYYLSWTVPQKDASTGKAGTGASTGAST